MSYVKQSKPKTTRIKASLSIRSDLRSCIDHEKNKSKIMNNALALYLAHKQHMAEAEQQRFDQMTIEGLKSAEQEPMIEMPDSARQSVDTIEEFLYRMVS